FAGERRLTDDEIRTIDRWTKDGAPEGNRSELPPRPRFASGWQLGTPDIVLTFPEYVLRADGADVFRNFVLPVPGTGTRFVRAIAPRDRIPRGNRRRPSRQHPRRSDERVTAARRGGSGAGIRGRDSALGRFSRRTFSRLDSRSGAAAAAGRSRLAPRRRRRH